MKMVNHSFLASFPDYYENSELLHIVKERIRVHIDTLSKECPTDTKDDAYKIVKLAVAISNIELEDSTDGLWIPQVIVSIEPQKTGPDIIKLELRSFCTIGAGLN